MAQASTAADIDDGPASVHNHDLDPLALAHDLVIFPRH
jgi:hypothetical protein